MTIPLNNSLNNSPLQPRVLDFDNGNNNINKNDKTIPTTSAFISEISNNIPMYTKKNVFKKKDS